MNQPKKECPSKMHQPKKDCLVDLGHPMLNRVVDGFVKTAGVGALRAAALDASQRLCADERVHSAPECILKRSGKEAAQWGVAAGMYSGLTYAMKEARGRHDWKNAAIGGALTGAALSLTDQQNRRHDRILQAAITGAAVATTAEILRKLTH